MKIIVSASPGEWRVAVWDGTLVDYALERPAAPDGVGDLYRGRVTAIVPAMAGAFVVLGTAEGFLPDSEAPAGLTEGATIGVRVTRAAQGGKGPRLTARLDLSEAAAVGVGAPCRLRRGPTAAERLAALHPEAPVIAGSHAAAAALRPALGDRVSVGPDFDDAVEAEVDVLAAEVATLPGGARLSVHPTPALTAIDVDLGPLTAERRGKAAAQEGANRALLPALARQIRLRNLGGAILVDLGGLSVRRRAALGPGLAAALADDPLRPRFLGFSALGLAEILRPRVHPPLHEHLAGPYAAGLAALRQAAREAASRPEQALLLRAAPAVIAAVQGDPAALTDLAQRTGRPLMLRPDPMLPPCQWMLETPPRV